MFKYGLLLLTYRANQLSSLASHVGSYLKMVNTKISNTLYISLESNQRFTSKTQTSSSNFSIPTMDLIMIVPRIYAEAHKHAPRLDVRVLHHPEFHSSSTNVRQINFLKRKLYFSPEVIFTNEDINKDNLRYYLNNNFDIPDQLSVVALNDSVKIEKQSEINSSITDQVFEHVCLGGTFDNLHNGHKVLLSIAQLKCSQSLTIGVTAENMVRHKTLWELIESPEQRIEKLSLYLKDVDPFIKYKISEITDPFGPAIVDDELQSIIVSDETIKGGHKINDIRESKGMAKLEVEAISLLSDDHKESQAEEDKVSSSSLRIRKLGTLLKEPEAKSNLPSKPYLIGLTGMIASGKSSISEKLRKLGAAIINVDLLAHQTYRSATAPAYKEIVDNFGKDILDEDGNIIRVKLAKIVFDDESKLQLLNKIIWPKVEQMVLEEIEQLKEKYSVIILEIALLIEAKWQDKVHQIWLSILDEKEAVRRLKVRNQLTEEQAIKRVKALAPNHEKIKYANVVFCTQWDESITWEQVKRAWKMLNDNYIKQ